MAAAPPAQPASRSVTSCSATPAGSPVDWPGTREEVTIAGGLGAATVTLRFTPPLRLEPGTYWLGRHAGGPAATAR
jgi:hypothetical protein